MKYTLTSDSMMEPEGQITLADFIAFNKQALKDTLSTPNYHVTELSYIVLPDNHTVVYDGKTLPGEKGRHGKYADVPSELADKQVKDIRFMKDSYLACIDIIEPEQKPIDPSIFN